MRLIPVVVASLLFGGCANRYVNGGALAASTLALACDWGQTRSAAVHDWPRGRYETNPVMGPRPTAATVDVYFGFAALMNAAIWLALPQRWRSAAPAVISIGEVKQVSKNMSNIPMCGIGDVR